MQCHVHTTSCNVREGAGRWCVDTSYLQRGRQDVKIAKKTMDAGNEEVIPRLTSELSPQSCDVTARLQLVDRQGCGICPQTFQPARAAIYLLLESMYVCLRHLVITFSCY